MNSGFPVGKCGFVYLADLFCDAMSLNHPWESKRSQILAYREKATITTGSSSVLPISDTFHFNHCTPNSKQEST